MDLQINIDADQIRAEAIRMANAKCRDLADRLIGNHFNDGRYSMPPKPGVGYTIIRNTIDDYLLSSDMQEAITRIVKEQFEAKLVAAVEYALIRKARKIASQMTGTDEPIAGK